MATTVSISSVNSWSLLDSRMLKNYHSFGAGFLEVWFMEYAWQKELGHTYSSSSDVIQCELGGTAVYQDIAYAKFNSSFDFFKKFKKYLRPIGGHDIDALVIDERKLKKLFASTGYQQHPARNGKFWYRQQNDPITGNPIGIVNKRTEDLFGPNAPAIQYDLFRGMNVSGVNMKGCKRKLIPIKAYGITKYNLPLEDLLVLKLKIIDNHGMIKLGGKKKALRPKDFVDVMNLFGAIDPDSFDYDYFLYRLKKNRNTDCLDPQANELNREGHKRNVGEINSKIPYADRSVDQRVMTMLNTLFNHAKKRDLHQWARTQLSKRGLSESDIKGIVFRWEETDHQSGQVWDLLDGGIQNNIRELVPRIREVVESQW